MTDLAGVYCKNSKTVLQYSKKYLRFNLETNVKTLISFNIQT